MEIHSRLLYSSMWRLQSNSEIPSSLLNSFEIQSIMSVVYSINSKGKTLLADTPCVMCPAQGNQCLTLFDVWPNAPSLRLNKPHYIFDYLTGTLWMNRSNGNEWMKLMNSVTVPTINWMEVCFSFIVCIWAFFSLKLHQKVVKTFFHLHFRIQSDFIPSGNKRVDFSIEIEMNWFENADNWL